MTKHEAAPTTTTLHFKRGKSNGLVLVLKEGQYVMAEYSERTGQVMAACPDCGATGEGRETAARAISNPYARCAYDQSHETSVVLLPGFGATPIPLQPCLFAATPIQAKPGQRAEISHLVVDLYASL